MLAMKYRNQEIQFGEWFQPALLPPPGLSPALLTNEYVIVKRHSMNPTPAMAAKVFNTVKSSGKIMKLSLDMKLQYHDAGAALFRYDDLWVRGFMFVRFKEFTSTGSWPSLS